MIPNFRVWDIRNKCYYNMTYAEDLYIQDQSIYSRDCSLGEEDIFLNVSKKYIVEMGSGIPDTNGDEIFEGSIVEHNDEHGKIDFREGCFWIDFEGWTNTLSEFYFKELEIVGHIHNATQTA